MTLIDLKLTAKIRQDMERIEAVAAEMPQLPNKPTPQNVYTNFALLLKTLEQFIRRSGKAPFLPGTIATHISEELEALDTCAFRRPHL